MTSRRHPGQNNDEPAGGGLNDEDHGAAPNDERSYFAETRQGKPKGLAVAAAPNAAGSEEHYHGHRDRLRLRFRDSGDRALADYELLELLLFRLIPRRDTKPIAKALLARFGSLPEVLGAPTQLLTEIKGVGDSVATDLKLVAAISHRMLKGGLKDRQVLASWSAVNEYCRAAMAFEAREQFRVLFLDKKNTLIADEIQQTGTVDHTPVYPREVVKRALQLEASALIMVHNHPSGDPMPSHADIEMTKLVRDAAKAVGVTLHDHLVIGKGQEISFRSAGLL